MDADKLNEAAEKAATIQYRNLSDPDVSQDGRTEAMFASMFEQGAQWLMTLPLSDRLTDEEKERIKAIYSESQRWLNEEPNEYNSTLKVIAVGLQDRLERIFGKELFNEK